MLNLRIVLVFLMSSVSIAFAQESDSKKRFELSEPWQFVESGKQDWSEAIVPGVVHLDLLRNELIEDPYNNNNEILLRWIEEKNWEYKTVLKATSTMLEYQHLNLIFEGLDTYATIYINDKKVLSTNNMFREWKLNLKPLINLGDNELKIIFESPLNHNKTVVENYSLQLPSGNETVDLKVSPFTRKAIYQFGWDWGPRFVTAGIWKPLFIEAWNDVSIENAFCETLEFSTNKALMRLEVIIESSEAKGHYKLKFLNQTKDLLLQKGENKFSYQFEVENPKLWWPNGMGEPKLYDLDIKVKEDGRTVSQKSVRYGIRTIELINEPDSIGTSFYFKINGKPIFIKGANYVPQDAFLPRVKDTDYETLIEKAKEANMNMLRVWGGGIYEKDIFYNLCDKNGILVWQDFMFANSLYPSNIDFKLNVANEIKDNVKRLRSHPSIALWCGNNEIEVAWGNWGWQNQFGYTNTDSTVLWNSQKQLFHHLIPDILSSLYPTANYTTTTPLSNWGTPENFNHSTMHYWGVWHGKEPFENFKTNVGRFMVEYGFQSFPNYKLLKQSVDKDQLNLESEVMNNRQKSYIGNGMITKHAEKWFGEPKNFKAYVENSQKTQALALRTAITEHRLKQPHCMGTLFWQFNDCWPGPSWSVLNYDESEKIAYQTVKNWYAPIIVIPSIKNNILQFDVISDRPTPFKGQIKVKIKGDHKWRLTFDDIKVSSGKSSHHAGWVIKHHDIIEIKVLEKGKIIWSTNVNTLFLF